ncbi:VCBS repeat-containing protein, partial [Fulvivirgaceae bacterium BMA12]|nr:VCBS repeat-containing protein [Fulvivirgaceae bacterium BMA12]
MKTIRIFIFFCWLGSLNIFGQEICNNDIDDDGDGFIDCFDTDCANNSFCDGTFLGNDVSCQAQPTQFPTFSMSLDWDSADKTAVHFGRLAIGDLDNDGVPEVVSFNTYDDRIYILDGSDGSTKFVENVGPDYRRRFDHDIAIANLNNDNCGEIFVMGKNDDDDGYTLASYDCQLNELWIVDAGSKNIGALGLADFDGNGTVELYYKDEIRNAATGAIIVASTADFDDLADGGVAVDIAGDDDLELVVGGTIFDVNLGAGTATSINTMPGYNVKGRFPSTSVADYNLDGNLDVIATGGDASNVTTIFFWDVATNTVLTYSDAFGTGDYEFGWNNGAGRVNIADIDGDANLNITYVSGEYLYALDENMNQLWRSQINEQSSGYTGCTLFDFNGDGISEVVYRDEEWLYIINGVDGSLYPGGSVACISRTFIEYPIVADVDADGATELCVTCGQNDALAWANFWTNSYSQNSHVRVFESAGEPWVPARRLWNQHAYFNVNINDDMTIPPVQQKHHLAFSTGTCTTGPNRPLNSFLNQSPYLDSNGCPVYASPDLAFVNNSLSVQVPTCPDQNFQVSFQVENLGDIDLSGNLPITFYEGDPTQPTANRLNTETVTVTSLVPGGILDVNNLPVNGNGGNFVLYIVLNDDGTTIPLNLPNTDFFECDYSNNILSENINPLPFSLTAEASDNTVCDITLPGTGSARAYRLVGMVEETADYTFNWYDGTSVSGAPDFTGPVYSNLSDGDYTVFALHNTAGCSSDTVTITVNLTPQSITAAIILQAQYTNCNNPNGHLEAEVNGGEPVGLFTYEWYQGDNIFTSPLIGTSHSMTGLAPGQYTLLVTEKATGCQTIETYTIIDDSVPPVVNASATDATCPNPTSGTVTANVNGVNGGHSFAWYIGNSVKPTADFTTNTVNNLAPGDYTVVATKNSDQCSSTPITVTVSIPSDPVVSVNLVAEQTSCDPMNPNGAASANVGGVTAGYTFVWHEGQGTAGLVVSNSANATGLGTGPHTVEVTDNATGCSATAEIDITQTLTYPTVTANVDAHQTDCAPANGQLSASVGGTTAGYTFYWFDGNIGTPDINNPDATGTTYSGLVAGDYTVVAVDNNTSCPSSRVVAQVADNTVLPAINVNVTDQTSCDPLSPNGELSADVGGVTAGFTFTWYQGAGTGGAVISNVASATSLAAGVYTVEAVNNTTGCVNTAQRTLNNNFVYPTVTAVLDSDQTICDPLIGYDGQVSANVGGTTAGFTFLWYDGNVGTPDLNNPDFTGAVYSGLTAGTYTVVALGVATSCPSNIATISVANNTVAPTITTNVTDQTSCDLGNPNGQLSANVGGVTAGYTFTWYQGAGTGGGVISNVATAASLAAGVYTVEVVNDATGCSSTSQTTLNNNLTYPTAATNVDAHQTDCTPPNGQVSASVGGITAGYTFYWFDGNIGTPDINNPDATGITYSGLVAGDYTVVAVDNNTLCPSNPVVAQVNDNTVIPAINVNVTDQTSCDPLAPNGELSADIGGVTAGFTFTWYQGAGTGGAVISNVASATGLIAGVYTVEVVNNTTGCSNTSQTTLNNNFTYPTVAAIVDADQTICDPLIGYDGQVSANVGGVTAGFTFLWYDGTVGTPDVNNPDFTGPTYSGLTAGTYTVLALGVATSCPSNPLTVTVADNTVAPAITTNVTDQTSCDPLAPNGQLSANIGGVTAGYTFTWYQGAGTGGAVISNVATATSLAAGVYTVEVVNDATGCSNTEQTTLNNNFTYPTVTPVVDANQTFCNPVNGELSAHVGGVTAGYTFYWFNGNVGTPDITMADATGIQYNSLAAGDYTVVAVDNNTLCPSSPVVVQVADNTVLPAININVTAQTSCDPLAPNGELSADIGGVTAGFTFTWYQGAGTGGAVISNVASATSLPAGVYTVQAVNNTTGCINTAQTTLNNNLTYPSVATIVDSDQTICDPLIGYDGQVSANVGGVTAGFTFLWYDGNVGTPDINNPDFTGPTYSGLTAGTYTVVALGVVTNCPSSPLTVDVADNTVTPAINTNVTAQTSCDLGNPNGQLSADVGGVTAGYTFTWYQGAGTGGAVISNVATATSLAAGVYTVEVVNDVTGCSNTEQTTLNNNFTYPTVTPVVDANQTFCNPVNGELSAHVGGVTAGYTFYWFNGNVGTPDIPMADATGIQYDGLAAGDYTVVAVNNNTLCPSSPVVVQVADNTVLPNVVAAKTDNTACDPLLYNGTISAGVGAVGAIAGYTFHIFSGQSTAPANELPGSPSDNLNGLTAGIYTVQAIDNTTGCANTTEVTVANNIVQPTLSVLGSDVMGCSPLDGSITASVNVGVVGDYTFSWYNGSSVKATPDYLTTGNILSGLDAGTYTVNAYNDVLGCLVQAPQTITINRDPSTVITITELPAELTIPSDCNVAGGQLGVQAASPGNVGGFSFSWFQGDVNTTMVPIGSGTDFPVNSNRLGSLLSGRYTVIAQDNDTGCQDSLAIDLPYAGSPTLLSITIRDNDNCTASNGEFTVQVTPSASAIALGADETWFAVQIWKDGVMVDTQTGAFPNNVFVGLQPGDYTVIAVETNPALSGCSTSEDATIGNVAVPPVITTNSILDNRNCSGATGTGVISLTIDGVANPASGYSYNWFQGQTTAAPPLPAGNITAPGHSAINLTGGYYTVEVIDNADPNNTCSSVATFFINDNPLIISINSTDINLTHQTDCTPPFLGDATVTDVYIDGISNAGTTGFTFDWFESDGITLVGGAGTGDSPAVNLAPGDYFVRATNTASNCMSSLVGFEILDNTMPPNVVMVHDAPNTICDILTYTPNGQLSASVTEGVTTGVTAGYTFEWFSGQNNTNPVDALPAGNIAGGNGEIAQNLAPGFYTVRVTDIASPNNSCQTISTMEVQDVPDIVNILTTDIAITNQNDCAPPNGSATVNSVIVNGVGQPPAGFSFDWYQSDAATLVAGAGNAATVGVNLTAGTYFVQATSNTSGCASSLVEFEVLDVSQVPVVVMVHDAPNTICDILTYTPNGQLSASVTEGVTTGVTAGYTFEWFSGQNNTNPADALPAGNIAGGNGEIAQNLAPGFYTVRVTDNVNPNNSCLTVSTMEVQDVPDIVNILTTDIAITNQND